MPNKKLKKSLKKFYGEKEDVQEILYGELGIPINGVKKVDVPGRAGYVYARIRGNNSELVQAYNSTVPSKYDYPVIITRKGNTYIIAGKDQGKYGNMGNSGNATTTVGVTPLPNHGGQHSFNPSLGMGADPVWVYPQQFMPNVAYPSGSSLMLTINPHFYEWDGQWKYTQATGTPSFAPYVPTITGSSRMALLFVNGDTGALEIAGGVGFSGGINNAAELAQYIPDIDRNTSIPIAAVKLNTGTTALDYSDIYDMRDFFTVQKYFQGIGVLDNGVPQGTGTILDFADNLSVSFSGSVATISGQAGGAGGVSSVNGYSGTVVLGASDIGITDSGGFYTGTTVEAALQETKQLFLEVNDQNIYNTQSASATLFQGTIATLPGGSTLTYNIGSGNEDILKPQAATYIGNVVLHNTTRGTSALISDCNTATNTITLTASVPGDWQVGDTITPESQTNTSTIGGGAAKFIDIRLNASGALGKSGILLDVYISDTGGAGQQAVLHPYETNGNPKRLTRYTLGSTYFVFQVFLPLVGNTICMAWTASGSGTFSTIIRLNGWIP